MWCGGRKSSWTWRPRDGSGAGMWERAKDAKAGAWMYLHLTLLLAGSAVDPLSLSPRHAMKASAILPFLFALCLAQDDGLPHDPYLPYRPPFARSLPVQIILTGIVFTLVLVLLVHLLFTAQYHWPLAPVNYVLQLSGVTTLLISLIATIHVILSSSYTASAKWPYMLDYIAVYVPPLDILVDIEEWTAAERATWLVMNASTSGLIQITHIQFLTLLYPSRLEGRLIFALLGPLAILSAIMQLLPISNNADVVQLSTDVRNVCNATLSLLFTLALFIWGFLVNRKQAWRTDGGTAVFGSAALSLAVLSTALNFLHVHKEQDFIWLSSVMWTVVLWQSFLGWWWWVGAGSSRVQHLDRDDREVEDKAMRAMRKEKKRLEAREKRRETRMRAQNMWKGVAGAFRPSQEQEDSEPQAHRQTRRRRIQATTTDSDDPGITDAASQLSRTSSITVTVADEPNSTTSSTSSAVSTTPTTTTHTQTPLPNFFPQVVHRYYAFLRREHNAAARVQAVQRVERMRAMGRSGARADDPASRERPPSVVGWGWGWHGFGWRRRSDVGIGPRGQAGASASDAEKGRGRSGSGPKDRSRSLSEIEMKPPRARRTEEQDDDDMYVSEEDEPSRIVRTGKGREEGVNANDQERDGRGYHQPGTPAPPADEGRSSIWWWGPLKRWRLQDSTTY